MSAESYPPEVEAAIRGIDATCSAILSAAIAIIGDPRQLELLLRQANGERDHWRQFRAHIPASRMVDAFAGTFGEAMGDADPYPLADVLERLASAADHLLIDHGCDRHGYEEVCSSRDAARRFAGIIRGAIPLRGLELEERQLSPAAAEVFRCVSSIAETIAEIPLEIRTAGELEEELSEEEIAELEAENARCPICELEWSSCRCDEERPGFSDID